jgi:EmrB/QacA subfamily drug resistance transporter
MSSLTVSRAQNSAPTAAPRHRAVGLFLILLAQLMLVLDATVVNVALPDIAVELDFTPAGLSWVLSGYTLAFGGLLLLGGRLGDVYGRRRFFLIGLAVFVLSSLIGGLSVDPAMLIAFRALQGLGAALAAPSVLALITTTAPDEAARNRGLAAFTAVSSGGAALGLILGGVLTDVLDWRATLFINVPIGMAVLALVPRFVGETERRHGRFDVVGAIAATGAAGSIVWTLVEAPDAGWSSARTVLGFVLGAALIALLGWVETHHAHPLLRPALLQNRHRVAALVTIAALYGGMLATFFLLVQFLEGNLALSPLMAGLAFLPMPISVFTMSRLSPRLVRRFGPARLIVAGTVGVTAAMAWLSHLSGDAGYLSAMPAMFVIGLSMGMSFMPISVVVLGGVEPEHAGSASGLLQTMQQLGGSVGLAVVASVFAAHQVPGDFLRGAHYGFLAAVVLSGLALIAALTQLVRRRPAAPRLALSES